MTLAQAIAKAQAGAEVLRQKATVPFTPNAETALLIEQCKSIEHVCAVARQHLAPESVEHIAQAMLDRAPAQVSGMITIKKGDA
jgi:hypothetical protein